MSVRANLVDDRLSVDCIVHLIRDGTLQAPGPIRIYPRVRRRAEKAIFLALTHRKGDFSLLMYGKPILRPVAGLSLAEFAVRLEGRYRGGKMTIKIDRPSDMGPIGVLVGTAENIDEAFHRAGYGCTDPGLTALDVDRGIAFIRFVRR